MPCHVQQAGIHLLKAYVNHVQDVLQVLLLVERFIVAYDFIYVK